jgi:hypothetical protein
MGADRTTRIRVLTDQQFYCFAYLHSDEVGEPCLSLAKAINGGEASVVVAFRSEWRGFCRACWARLTSDARGTKAARTRDFKRRQLDRPFPAAS